MKYLNDSEDYPCISNEILPLGTMYTYISSTFVNGFLNYSKPISAYLLHRYESDSEVNAHFANIFNNHQEVHVNLRLGDDIMILSKSETGEYWFFWLDNDVSDCCIGRFITNDSEETVIKEFESYVHERQTNLGYVQHSESAIKLDINKFTGWMKF